jgi:hypothetical protein
VARISHSRADHPGDAPPNNRPTRRCPVGPPAAMPVPSPCVR